MLKYFILDHGVVILLSMLRCLIYKLYNYKRSVTYKPLKTGCKLCWVVTNTRFKKKIPIFIAYA